MVHSIQDNGDLRVLYGARHWIINPSAVVKVCTYQNHTSIATYTL